MEIEKRQEYERYGRAILGIALMLQLYSYVLPADFPVSNERLWGPILWFDALPSIFWSSLPATERGLLLVAFGCPIGMLLYLATRLRTLKQEVFKSLPTWLLVNGLIVPHGMMGIIYLRAWWMEQAPKPTELAGYWMWVASFLLFFLGFYLLKKSNTPNSTSLSDHLIDRE